MKECLDAKIVKMLRCHTSCSFFEDNSNGSETEELRKFIVNDPFFGFRGFHNVLRFGIKGEASSRKSFTIRRMLLDLLPISNVNEVFLSLAAISSMTSLLRQEGWSSNV